MNRTPPGTKAINTRYPPDVLEGMRKLAQAHERSFNSEVVWALRNYIAQQTGDLQMKRRLQQYETPGE